MMVLLYVLAEHSTFFQWYACNRYTAEYVRQDFSYYRHRSLLFIWIIHESCACACYCYFCWML